MRKTTGAFSLLLAAGLFFWGCGSNTADSFDRELNGKTFTASTDNGEAVYEFDRTRVKIEKPGDNGKATRYLNIERIVNDEKKLIVALPADKKAYNEDDAGKYMPYYVYFWETLDSGEVLFVKPPEVKKPNMQNALNSKRPADSKCTIITLKPAGD
ncbi:MAG: hypothetical protein ACOCWZ_11925 [Spirochaetota bacterium]